MVVTALDDQDVLFLLLSVLIDDFIGIVEGSNMALWNLRAAISRQQRDVINFLLGDSLGVVQL